MRFAVLHHTGWPGHADHFDLMLQCMIGTTDDDLALLAFATEDDRFPVPGVSVLQPLEKHRRAYLDFEGKLSGERGRVERVDGGSLMWLKGVQTAPFSLTGKILKGIYRMNAVDNGLYKLAAEA
jgi:hypothetical protein